ncbi:MFS transporter prlG [Colletotrichum spaethianum]|uniref:MFS transporter prlG n=1 Tax=Colletotrichum spaethianum TaxID=700344 RepID=A0AA37PDZ4_9PEZI|nr:MFS transporter prlG [Colletotrichum spaethianum]GKT50452.1 MFS transporter prlG [Colletotrichum spaethianum]
MGTAFSSIPDDDESTQPPNSPPWSWGNRPPLSEKESLHVVDWNKPHDPENPMHWTAKSRWVQIVLVSALTLQVAIASSMPAPAVADTIRDFKAPKGVLSSLVVSIFNLGIVVGTVLAAPLSELYGRYPVYVLSIFFFLACNAACAVSPNLGILLLFRLLSGAAGAAPLAIGGGTIADVALPAWRGRAVSVYSSALLLGSVIGPVTGGFLSQYFGWRWIFWSLCIVASVIGIATSFFLRETSAKILLERRAQKVRKRTGDLGYFSALAAGVSPSKAFSKAIKRPFRLLILNPIVLAFSSYFAVIYGYLHLTNVHQYLFFTTLPAVFTGKYGFSVSFSGLTFLGVGIGIIVGVVLDLLWSDRIAASLLLKTGARRPELRLTAMAYSVPLIPAGLLLYGWTAEKSVFWLAPMTGSTIFGVGVMLVFTPLTSYFIEVFTIHAASALAAATIVSGIFATFLPLVGSLLYATLGLGWENTVLAALAVVVAPVPWFVMKKGQAMREKHAYQAF